MPHDGKILYNRKNTMNSFKTKNTVLFAAVLAAMVSGCSDPKPPVQPMQPQVAMVQQCGQNTQTGQTECIMVPAQGQYQQGQYPQQAQQNNGMGVGTVLGAAALGGAAGYYAGKNSGQSQPQYQQPNGINSPSTGLRYRSDQQTRSNFVPGPGPIGTQYRQVGQPAVPVAPAFKPQAAAVQGTVKPMSIPPSAARPTFAQPAAVRPAFTSAPARTSSFSAPPARSTFTPTRSAPRSTFSSSSARKR
jgi:hypothetical protein